MSYLDKDGFYLHTMSDLKLFVCEVGKQVSSLFLIQSPKVFSTHVGSRPPSDCSLWVLPLNFSVAVQGGGVSFTPFFGPKMCETRLYLPERSFSVALRLKPRF
ncbi:hypothetical protein TNCV_3881441 [Trichonephila clavipes]|nr:hypothetical protein TNCV_3881441 [Trichonephila clavipes]